MQCHVVTGITGTTSGMRTDEMLLFKSWDEGPNMSPGSIRGPHGVARQTLHTAFADPTSSLNAPVRKSLEMRFACFWPPEYEVEACVGCSLRGMKMAKL